MANDRNAGRPKGDRFNKKYWTDLKTHATIQEIVTARKTKELTDENLNSLVEEVYKIKKQSK